MLGTILLLALSGTLAGIVTGLASASASTVVIPLLVVFGPYVGHTFTPFTAITISLFTDVFSSSVSAYTYKKNGNIKLKEGMILSITAVIFSIIGTYFASNLSDDALGSSTGFFTLCTGIIFFYNSKKKKEQFYDKDFVPSEPKPRFADHQTLASIVFGAIIGLICGFTGAGGGMMILLILAAVLGYDTKTAIGTSVLIMTFTALAGGIAHIPYLIEENIAFPFIPILITGTFAIIGARIASTFANKVPEYKLLRVVSITFMTLGFLLVLQKQLSL